MKKFLYLIMIIFWCSCTNQAVKEETAVHSFDPDTSFTRIYATGSQYNLPFRKFLDMLSLADEIRADSLVRQFLVAQAAFPIVEADTIVHFLYWGNADSVSVASDATGWEPTQPLKPYAGTKLWISSVYYPHATRIEYKIVVNGTKWMLDSLNNQIVSGGMGDNSELVLPGYQSPGESTKSDSIPYGMMMDTLIDSKALGERRKVTLYLPPGYESGAEKYPVIMFHDGIQFSDMTHAPDILDNLIYSGKITPLIAVFVEPVLRDEEYSGDRQDEYDLFVSEELTGFLENNFRTLKGPENWAQAGISNGGNIALYIVVTNPQIFGKAAALSTNVQDIVFDEFETSEAANIRIYLLVGKYDLPVLKPMIYQLKSILESKSYIFSFNEYPEGHNWAFWQKYLPDALIYLFPAKQETK